ncbi:MAG: ParB/RepB/Spo0J family partition protein [Fimbriimonadaceae bacterium]
MRKALGKGLSQLIAEQSDLSASEISVDSIVPNPRQPRLHFNEEALEDLANSIKQVGVLQPLVVRPIVEGKYELIAGERRFRASKLAGLKTVPIIVRSAGNQQSLEIALIENVQREDIGPVEAAKAYRRLLDEFELTHETVAIRVGKSRASISNTVRLLALPERIIEALESGQITEGHARPLLTVSNPLQQIAMFELIVKKGLNTREVEQLVSKTPRKQAKRKTVVDQTDPNWRALQERLSEHLGAPVKLQGSEKGGTITIPFFSESDLIRIADVLGIELA